jgi:tetratricopeptide (TPR) repeat protein
MLDKLREAKDLAEVEPDRALVLCNEVLNEHFDDVHAQQALFITGYIFLKAERFGMAYNVYQRCCDLRPNQAEIYVNMGMCVEEVRPDEAIKHFRKAQRLQPDNANAYANEGLIALQQANPKRCIYLSDKALELNPKSLSALQNRSLGYLMERDFKRGFRDFYKTLGVDSREHRDYGCEEWTPDSEPGTIVVYLEQGCGDGVMYASCIPDLIADGFEVIIDAESRLEGVFKTSFPECHVYGDRFNKTSRVLDYHKPRYQTAIGQLPYKYRKKESDFPGSPYMAVDPDLKVMWGALFDTFKGKKVGVAWRGGRSRTGKRRRSMELCDLEPVFNNGNTYINLEYKEVALELLFKYSLKHYPKVTGKGQDFDELFALVSQLDYVVTACTTVVYIAGSLGIPCIVLVPEQPGYRYHLEGESFPWYSSVYLVRQKGSWRECAERVASLIKEKGL